MDTNAQLKYSIEDLLRSLLANKGSDLHISAGSPPRIRVNGPLLPLNIAALTPSESMALIHSILSPYQLTVLERERELNTALGISGLGRFRVNIFHQRSALAAAFRTIPYTIPTFEALGLPERVFHHLCGLRRGLVLVTGSTGNGKSTTLAAIIDYINSHNDCHIVTVEDPLEFLHKNKRSLVNQREIGPDSHSFAAALRHVTRQDPNVVMVGEMRDPETVRQVLELAETGHLVFAALPTADAVQSINRVIDIVPTEEKEQVRTKLSFALEAIVSQQLLPMADGSGRRPALEILVGTSSIRSTIRDGRIHQIYSVIQTSARDGMVTMNASLLELFAAGRITHETAMAGTGRADELAELIDKLRLQRDKRARTSHSTTIRRA